MGKWLREWGKVCHANRTRTEAGMAVVASDRNRLQAKTNQMRNTLSSFKKKATVGALEY